MEPWRYAFRNGIARVMSDSALRALRDGLREDDPALIQSQTVIPACGYSHDNDPACSACAIAYAGWRGGDCRTARQVEDYFAAVWRAASCHNVPRAGVGDFVTWFDTRPRAFVFNELANEIDSILAERVAPCTA